MKVHMFYDKQITDSKQLNPAKYYIDAGFVYEIEAHNNNLKSEKPEVKVVGEVISEEDQFL